MLRTYHFSFTTLRTLQLKYFTMPESLCFISYSEKTQRKQERISCKNIVKTVNLILLNCLENSPSSMHSLHREEMALEILFSLFFSLSQKYNIIYTISLFSNFFSYYFAVLFSQVSNVKSYATFK